MIISIDSNVFKALGVTVAKNDTRHYLNGLYLESKGGKLFAVTTDGHRLTSAYLGASEGVEEGWNIIISNDIFKTKALVGKMPVINLAFSEDLKTVTVNEKEIYKAIDGKYPNWRMIIPKLETHKYEKGELKKAYNFEHLQDINKQQSLLAGKKSIYSIHYIESDAALIAMLSYNVVTVLMPMRRGEEYNAKFNNLFDCLRHFQ